MYACTDVYPHSNPAATPYVGNAEHFMLDVLVAVKDDIQV
jgi:hypothetical protein